MLTYWFFNLSTLNGRKATNFNGVAFTFKGQAYYQRRTVIRTNIKTNDYVLLMNHKPDTRLVKSVWK